MHTRHTNELMLRLERVADIGVAEVRRAEMMKWFDKDRLTVGVWAEVNEKWTEVLTADGYTEDEIKHIPLFVGEGEGEFVFVYGANLQVINPDMKAEGWLWPVTDWMKVRDRKTAKKTAMVEPEAA